MGRSKKNKTKSIFPLFVLAFAFFCGCIDPFYPDIRGYKSILVVDGLITNENLSYKIVLSRTFEEKEIPPVMITDATVYISDGDENRVDLINSGNGTYKTDSTRFRGATGKKYTLHINTSDGSEYESTPCTMYPVSTIDSVYYTKAEEYIPNQVARKQGIRLYIGTKTVGDNAYMRWSFDEVWKFKVPYPKGYEYINDSTILPITVKNEYCWKSDRAKEVLIFATNPALVQDHLDQPLNFIASNETDRLSLQYSILVKQYSLSPDEYDFWDNTKKVTESGSNIFGFQPFSVTGNIHNINNIEEKVLGYFQVSAVSAMRIYVTFNDIVGMGLPYYRNIECKYIAMSPKDYPMSSPFATPITFDDIYEMYVYGKQYTFVEPIYGANDALQKLGFTKPECADCGLTGNTKKPDFWVDLY